MNKEQSIEQIARQAFEHFEADVNPNAWGNISQHLAQHAATSSAGSTAAGKSASLLGKIGSSAWLTAGVVVTGVALVGGIIYFSVSSDDSKKSSAENIPASVITENKNDVAPVITTPEISAEKKISPVVSNHNNSSSTNNARGGLATGSDHQKSPSAGPAIPFQKQTDQDKPVINKTKSEGENKLVADKEKIQSVINEVKSEPIAAIMAVPVAGNAPLTVNLMNRGYASSAEWNFGDGSEMSRDESPVHTFTEPGKYKVHLTCIGSKGELKEDFIEIEVLESTMSSDVVSSVDQLPNIFTPNGDGRNDVFKLDGKNLREIIASVFDKNGKMIYKWNTVDGGWDGKKLNGEQAIEGTYFYIIHANGVDGQVYDFRSSVALVR